MLPGGVYNFGSETKQTMYDITCEMLHFLKSDRKPEEVPPAHNLWMDCTKAKERGILFSDAEGRAETMPERLSFNKRQGIIEPGISHCVRNPRSFIQNQSEISILPEMTCR